MRKKSQTMASKKVCDKCGKMVSIKRIHIVWIEENHSFSWLCGECTQEVEKRDG